MSLAHTLLSQPNVPVPERQQALDRIHADPGIPNHDTTSSFWLKDRHPQFKQLSNQDLDLPTEADVVIIGSGITGASIARHLLLNRKKSATLSTHPYVLMIEARDICSGATGRNSGHILETANDYADFADDLGEEAARKILRFRLAHLPEILRVAGELGLTKEAQVRKVQFVSAYFHDESWEYALERFQEFKNGMPEESAEWVAYSGSSIPEDLKLSNAKGVVIGPVGALWPYKLVTGILSDLLSKYPSDFRFDNHTEVMAIRPNLTSDYKYKVETTRGIVFARHIIHCTEAHVGHLLPSLRGRIFPVRGQMSAQKPGSNFQCQAHKSWIFNYDRGFDYLTQLPDGYMMLGGGFSQGESGGVADLGVSSDNELSYSVAVHLSVTLNSIFEPECWGRTQGWQVHAMWTGNMAFSTDGFPWVGRLPGSVTRRNLPDCSDKSAGGEWVCAGFGEDGMVQAWLSAKALAIMLLKGDGELEPTADDNISWLPEQVVVSKERIDKAVLPRFVADIEMSSL